MHRGLAPLADRGRRPGAVVALLCACAEAARCHRSIVADALADRHFAGDLPAFDVRTGRLLRGTGTGRPG